MRFLALLLALSVSPFAGAEMGFYQKGDFNIPPAVSQATSSVFQIITPQSDTYAVWWAADYQTPEFVNAVKDLKLAKQVLQVAEMDFCVANKLPICIVFDDIDISTGFVVFDKRHIATNRHVDEGLMIIARRELVKAGYTDAQIFKIFENFPVPVKIALDLKAIGGLGDKHLVFGRWFNQAPAFFTNDFGVDYMMSDLIVFSTEADIAEPLPIAKQPLREGEQVYVVGFPDMTFNRKTDYNVPDSRGVEHVSITKGLAISVDEGLKRLAALGSSVRELREKLLADTATGPDSAHAKWARLIFNDADSEHGASGAPYLNAQGEVVGIHSTGLLEYRGTLPSLTVSVGVAWPLSATPVADFQLLGF